MSQTANWQTTTHGPLLWQLGWSCLKADILLGEASPCTKQHRGSSKAVYIYIFFFYQTVTSPPLPPLLIIESDKLIEGHQ